MRILASNPDTIGDVLLRQPLFAALREAGHELCLIIRPMLEPLVPLMAPGARVIICGEDQYEPGAIVESQAWDGIVRQAREFQPELLLIAPYQWTALEERLSLELADIPCVALTGKRFSDPNHGPPVASRLRVTRPVSVSEDVAELVKNQLLASAVLEHPVSLPEPRLNPPAEYLEAADAVLARLGLEPGEYWTACVGDSTFTQVRNWEPERWGETLARWSERHGRKFLLIGQRSEEQTMRRVMEIACAKSSCASMWCGDGNGDLQILAGIIARSGGYVGRDTGPMHIAASLGKPVLAVFGGGTWPRFLPAAPRSVSVTVAVPCTGCGWVCHLQRSHCIKDVPVFDVLKAVDDLESGRVTGRETRVLKADATILASIGRGGAEASRIRLTELAVLRREQKVDPHSLTSALERALKQASRAEALSEELEALRAESSRRESVLRQRLAAAQNTAASREAELKDRLKAAETKLKACEGTSPEQLADLKRAYLERERELRAQLSRALGELNQRQSEESDLRLRLERLEADRRTLGTLTKQQETEVVVLRQRVQDLVASRWRRYGQRLGLCMTMPWENEVTNGKH